MSPIRCSRMAGRKKDLLWVERWMRKNGGTNVTLRKLNYPGAPWVVRGTLPITALAQFCCLETRKATGQ